MDMVNYLENMGITVCQRAFFSYILKSAHFISMLRQDKLN